MTSRVQVSTSPGYRPSMYQAAPVFLAFLVMGFGDAVGPFVSLAKQQFNLSAFMAQLIAFTRYIMFGILSVPMRLSQHKQGTKPLLILGLCIMLARLLIPTSAAVSPLRA